MDNRRQVRRIIPSIDVILKSPEVDDEVKTGVQTDPPRARWYAHDAGKKATFFVVLDGGKRAS